MTVDVDGTCDPRFDNVRNAFIKNFTDNGDVGAAVAVTHRGEMVVDLWAGEVDGARPGAWQRDTIVNVFSTTKGITALCAHVLMDRGQLDVDAPVARYWPEFAQEGKGDVPVRGCSAIGRGSAPYMSRCPSMRYSTGIACVRCWLAPNHGGSRERRLATTHPRSDSSLVR